MKPSQSAGSAVAGQEESERNSEFVEENLPVSRFSSQSVTMVTDSEWKFTCVFEQKTRFVRCFLD